MANIPVGQTGSSLPSGWQNQPTNSASFAAAVAIVDQHYGTKVANAFQAWYAAAWKKDPKITPSQAVVAFIVGYDVSGGVAKLGNFVTGGTAIASNPATGNLQTASGPGIPQAAAKAAESLALPQWMLAITGISGWFARGLKLVFGGILIVAGVLKLTNTDKTLNQVLPLVGGPVGKVLKV